MLDTVARDLQVLSDLDLELFATLETHVYADHLTGASRLKQSMGCKIAARKMLGLGCVDIGITEGATFSVGTVGLQPLFTPGHADYHRALRAAAKK